MTRTPARVQADIGQLKGFYNKLATGTQWEIARLLSHGAIKLPEINIQMLAGLQGTNVDKAPLVEDTLLDSTQDSSKKREMFEKAFERECLAKVRIPV